MAERPEGTWTHTCSLRMDAWLTCPTQPSNVRLWSHGAQLEVETSSPGPQSKGPGAGGC